MILWFIEVLKFIFVTVTGFPRHMENRELESPIFQTGKTQGICFKNVFAQGIYHQHRGNFERSKNNEFVILVDGITFWLCCPRIMVGELLALVL